MTTILALLEAIIGALRLCNRLIEPTSAARRVLGATKCRERLGGTLRYYHRDAA